MKKICRNTEFDRTKEGSTMGENMIQNIEGTKKGFFCTIF